MFFSSSELDKSTSIFVDPSQLEPDCLKCGLYKNCESPKMKMSGLGNKKILIIGDFPKSEEDNYGTHFSQESGFLLRNLFAKIGISLHKDCYIINAVNCRTPGRAPKQKEINCCSPFVQKTIEEVKPKIIIIFGHTGINSLFGKDFSNRTVDRWRGLCIPDQKLGCYIFPMIHPDAVLANKDGILQTVLSRDFAKIPSALNKEDISVIDYTKKVQVLTEYKSVERLLEGILHRQSKIMFDYEGTGLKPYRNGHKIVSIGLALSEKVAYAFPYKWRSFWTHAEINSIEHLWKKILSNKKILKMAHNYKFEDAWSSIYIGSTPSRWYWDTMMAAHILDNRSAFTGLKFQTFINFGVRPYDKHIHKFLDSKNGEFNTVEDAPFKDLLIYNGLDCLFGWMLYEKQKSALSKMNNLSRAYKLFMQGLSAMGTIQKGGISVDEKYYRRTSISINRKILKLTKNLQTGREARKFEEAYDRPIKLTSPKDLGLLFYEVLGKDPVFTPKGNYKVDKETLPGLGLPFADELLNIRRLDKARGTYLAQFRREICDGEIHPFFDLHIPVTYRSSSSKPNFQNLPKRDPEVKSWVRRGLIPSPGCVLCEADFSGAEVITSVCYHKDKNFYNYLVDPTTDMHRDNATDIWMLPNDMLDPALNEYTDEQKKICKNIRFFAKNNWTFAQFYGDWFSSCGEKLWENCVETDMKLPNGISVRDWLLDKGIFELGEIGPNGPTPGSFLEHCAHVEHKMWTERFSGYTKWKQEIVEFYKKYGYIETFFGFRFVGIMDRKQCTNYPIQGTSFHILVYTLIQVIKFIKKHGLRTKLIGQVHDSVIADVPVDELSTYLTGVNGIVEGLKNKFDWLLVPMEIEAEISRVREEGGNFSELKAVNLNNIKFW